MPSRNGRKYVARVSDLGQNELDCHAYGHPWVPQVPVVQYSPKLETTVLVQEVNCVRCQKIRTDIRNAHTKEKIGRSHYTEPDRFRVLEKIPRGRSAYQRESLERLLAQARSCSRRSLL